MTGLSSVGATVGHYAVSGVLGTGGMGDVYRARDPKLGRDVAIKILRFTSDPERLARFEREARVLAALNHPNIGAIYGVEDADSSSGSEQGVRALVLELVEGETLAKRLARGPIPLNEALAIARQIVEALEAAHAKGIVHRDLKPANIIVRADGIVKVLDFGLAKAVAETGDDVLSPTITAVTARAGTVMGSASYMSPEQARGGDVDRRADIWAFGCVLYEMLTGQMAFPGETVTDALAAVLERQPAWRALPATVPPTINKLLQRCLEKDVRRRLHDIADARLELDDAISRPTVALESSEHSVRDPAPRVVGKKAAWIVASALIGASAATALLWRPKSPTAVVTRFALALPERQLELRRQAVAISPDGSRIVYAADGKLFVRTLSELEPRAISGTDGAWHPVFSPDGQSLLFWADAALKKIPVDGGTPLTICQSETAPSGIEWSNRGVLFAQRETGIVRVSPNGGKPEVLVPVNLSEAVIHGPQLLPDGTTLLFTIVSRTALSSLDPWGKAQIVVQSLKTGARKTLIDGGSDARFIPSGHLVYAVGGTLLAVPFDVTKLALTAGPVSVVEGVRRATGVEVGAAQFAFSNTGSLVYMPGPIEGGQEALFLFDRKGGVEELTPPPGSYKYPRLSPDGTRVAFETDDGKQTNISIFDLSGASSARRLTFAGNNRFPVWSSDGRHVSFQSDREGDAAVFWQPVESGTAERLTKPDPGTSHVPESWAPNDDAFLFSVAHGSEISLWTFSVRDKKAAPFDTVRSTKFPTDAAFSPDGHWVAYQTSESGQGEATTYVQPFPPNGTKYQIAQGGRPQWSRDGNDLFYVPAPTLFMAVTITTRPSFMFTSPRRIPRGFSAADPAYERPYDVTPDGRILGVANALGQRKVSATPAIQVVLNWFDELRARVPAK